MLGFRKNFPTRGVVTNVTYPRNIFTGFGNAQISTAQSRIGSSSLLLDGTGDYLKSNDNDSLLIAGNFTIEFWLRWNVSNYEHYVMGNRIGGDYNAGAWQVGRNTASAQFQFSMAPSTTINLLTSPTNNTWYHFAIVRSGSTITTYRDGTSVATGTNSNTLFANFQEIVIGGFGSGTSDYFNGYLDEFRISNVARYTGNFTPSNSAFVNDSNTLCLLHFEGTNGSTSFIDDNS